MTTGQTEKRPHVVFCGCAYYETIPQAVKDHVFTSLRDAGIAVEAVADLCGMAAGRHPRLRHWARAEPLVVVACFPRAVRWLFEAAGTPLNPERTRLFNMRTQSPEEIARELMKDDGSWMIEEKSAPSAPNHQSSIENHQSDWVPWFPVIDYDRCANCKQCMNFCLFGVYGLSDGGRVEVQNPAGCKTNCPACARMCPRSAIIFPKYADSPINGDDVAPPAEVRERPAPDLRSLLRGDVYDRIRRRAPGQKRFSTDAPDSVPAGLCPTIDALRRDLDIPDDVLASLSGAELQRLRSQARTPEAGDGDKKESRNA